MAANEKVQTKRQRAQTAQDEECAQAEIAALLSELGAEGHEDGVFQALYGEACAEAARLLARAARLSRQRQKGGDGEVGAVDIRLVAALSRGEAPPAAELRKVRELRNEQPLPEVRDLNSNQQQAKTWEENLPEEGRLLAPSRRVELREPIDPWASLKRPIADRGALARQASQGMPGVPGSAGGQSMRRY